ncbi:MAG: DNA repair protein [Rhodobacteraceae bacterium PARR1]|nr:MAG: DNA repair protein [Rhodobacteraceae bacterium PARR1]
MLILSLTAGLAVLTFGALLGVFDWVQLPLRIGNWAPSQAGMALQLLLLLMLVALCLILPSLLRLSALEVGHRSFRISMDDVARAYRTAHAADRAGVFALSGEFESIRQRMEVLRRHPDLGDLEPELLELAAVMSHQSRDLARIYSDSKVDRARRFLRQRQEEVDAVAERLKLARSLVAELRTWLTDVEAEERQAHVQIKRLEADLREILPALGLELGEPARGDGNVVSLPKPLK